MKLYLACGDCLRFPAPVRDIQEGIASMDTDMVKIISAKSSVRNLAKYIQRADLNSEEDLHRLNSIAERTDAMTETEANIFSGALDAESINGLDDVLCIAQSLEQYEIIPEYCEKEIPKLLRSYKGNMYSGRLDKAMDCMEQASALALAVYGRELHQSGTTLSSEELAKELQQHILPHQNNGSLKNRHTELVAQFQSVIAKASASGIRSEAEKRGLAESWLELAVSFAKVPVKYEADILKQQEQTIPQLKMG